MRTHKAGANFARRGLTSIAGLAVVAGTITSVASPAQAAAGDGVATSASVSDTQWLVGSTKAVTVSWTNSVDTLTSVLARSPWPWGAAWTADAAGFASTGRVASGAQTITCTQSGVAIVFTISSASTTSDPTCKYQNTSSWKGVWIEGGGLSVSSTATISVAFPSGQITAPAASRTDSWLVGGYYYSYTPSRQAEPTITAYSDATHPDAATITLDFDGNGGTCTTTKITGYQGTWGQAPKENDCTRPGYHFTGWTTGADGTGIVIWPRGNINFTGDNRVYAQWFDPSAQTFPPGKPVNVVATGKWNRVQVNWDAPVASGSFPITNYLVTTSPGNRVCITSFADNKPTQCSFNGGLTPGAPYTFTVQALNGAGWGEPSASSNVTSPSNLKITSSSRSKVLFGLAGSKITLNVTTPGFAPGVKITPMVSYDKGAKWSTLKSDAFSATAAGAKTVTLKVGRNENKVDVRVKFVDPDGNMSDRVIVAPAK